MTPIRCQFLWSPGPHLLGQQVGEGQPTSPTQWSVYIMAVKMVPWRFSVPTKRLTDYLQFSDQGCNDRWCVAFLVRQKTCSFSALHGTLVWPAWCRSAVFSVLSSSFPLGVPIACPLFMCAPHSGSYMDLKKHIVRMHASATCCWIFVGCWTILHIRQMDENSDPDTLIEQTHWHWEFQPRT